MAVVGVMILVVAVVFAAVTPVGVTVSEKLICAISSVGNDEGQEECVSDSENGRGGRGTDGEGDGDYPPGEDDPDDTVCEDEITLDRVSGADMDPLPERAEDNDMVVIQVGCVWYPVPAECLLELSGTAFSDVWKKVISGGAEASLDREGNDEIADCVTEGWGDESDDPDDDECNKTMPSSEDVSLDPPRIRLGCKWLPVPQDVCDDEWTAYKNAAPGRDRAAASGWLDECVTTAYDNMEPDCYVQVNTHIEDRTMSFLFFRFSKSEAVMIEKLGDGRIRVQMLKGSGFGGGVSGDNIFGSPISFGVAAIDGVTSDTAYEFTGMKDAQEWINWKKENDRKQSAADSQTCGRMMIGCDRAQRDYNDHLGKRGSGAEWKGSTKTTVYFGPGRRAGPDVHHDR
ncbi:hypothetical protein APR04_004635 [Promicromonospora umidemergens]|uniref:Uncharacterized protein n=1 Tax=Promicromonospora umidemergens TaxID=629679 RepID=A0ABP8XW23_9MICO|nr:hypothetical protein [Promicromonospora umidemergens]MCP2285700.1 hypothetical protein [Promicromonospora umidemergens]